MPCAAVRAVRASPPGTGTGPCPASWSRHRTRLSVRGRHPWLVSRGAPATLPALLADAVAHGALAWLARHATEQTISDLLTTTGAQRHLPMSTLPAWAGGQSQIAIGGTVAPPWLIAVLRIGNVRLAPETRQGKRKEVAREATRADPLSPADQLPAKTPVTAPPTQRRHIAETGEAFTAPWIEACYETKHAQQPARDQEIPPTRVAYPPLQQPPFDASLPTCAGGLLFLINVLLRLGFVAWQEQHREAPLCGLILGEALRRLRIEDSDSAWALASDLPAPESAEPRCWEAPPLWSDPRIGLTLPEDLSITPFSLAARWLAACRRYLRRVAHIGLASLCLRPARLQWTVTHLDVILPLAATDLRVRRQGLDIDPGWLDWLGRVVCFHYLDEQS